MTRYDLNTIRAVCEHCTVVAELWCGNGGGNRYVDLTPEQILEYLTEGEDYLLRCIGIAPDQFDAWREWRDLGGRALCGARTKAGTLCRNGTGDFRDFDEWCAVHRDEYCTIHGGDPH